MDTMTKSKDDPVFYYGSIATGDGHELDLYFERSVIPDGEACNLCVVDASISLDLGPFTLEALQELGKTCIEAAKELRKTTTKRRKKNYS